MNYCLQYKNGATVTIFAPYDCGNKCPFCVNKKEYQADATFDIDEVLDSIKKMDAITPNCDFVITGGEPFADLKSLDKILSLISGINAVHNCIGNTGHKVFINTTLPIGKYQEMEIIDFINMHSKVITGLNVSRHIRKYVEECDDKIFYYINVPVRINCVLYEEKDATKITRLIDRFSHFDCVSGFQIREDYTGTTVDNLYELEENSCFAKCVETLNSKQQLFSYFENNLIFGNDFRWNCRLAENISYHRTLPYSCIIKTKGKEINDIIINPRGVILDDWNDYGQELDLEKYKAAVKEKRNG